MVAAWPDAKAAAAAPPRANCAEGFLFPDTYELSPTMTAAEIAKLQVARFHSVAREALAGIPGGGAEAINRRPSSATARAPGGRSG